MEDRATERREGGFQHLRERLGKGLGSGKGGLGEVGHRKSLGIAACEMSDESRDSGFQG